MITDPVQRTKALYGLEREMEYWPGRRQLGPRQARHMLEFVWRRWNPGFSCPALIWRMDSDQLPECYGWERITLTGVGHCNVTLLHEIAHAMRFGTGGNPHTRGFVVRYTSLLHAFMPHTRAGWWLLPHTRALCEMRGLL